MTRHQIMHKRHSIVVMVTLLLVMNIAISESTEPEQKRATEAEAIIGHLFDGYQIIQDTVLRLRSIVCNSSVGRIPGKLTDENKAYFSYNKREYVCHNYEVIEARRIPNTGEIPSECEGKGYVTNDDKTIYPVVVYNKHGEIPGKAYDGTYGYYGFDRGQYRRRRFDWFC